MTFVGRSVKVPRAERPNFNVFFVGGGADVDDAADSVTGDSGSGPSRWLCLGEITGSTIIASTSPSSSFSVSSVGSGTHSAMNVSLPALELPPCLQAFNTTSLLWVNSHSSTYCHTRFLGVRPVAVSSRVPCSISDLMDCCIDDIPLLAAL